MDIINSNIQNYAEKYTSDESEILIELRGKTFGEREDKNMLSGFYQGRLLAMFSKMLNPKRILEVGTYMGYSTLCLAEGLSEDGKIITLDIEPETNEIAKDFWARTDLNSKIEPHLGQADEIIPTLDETFDLVFIDADKSNYKHYYDLVFPKMRIGGLIIADNVLWSGDVLNAENGEDVKASTKALHEYNVKINSDERVSNILVAVRDGLMISRKEKE
ncbi:MAG: O-methyltransferase [Acidobacteriota bacterium]|nr:O-methyltransferase [Acidobacteriota bacterium]